MWCAAVCFLEVGVENSFDNVHWRATPSHDTSHRIWVVRVGMVHVTRVGTDHRSVVRRHGAPFLQ